MAILQLPYNLSALFNFNEPDTNEGAMESSDEDFFDLFDFLPENTVTTNYLAKGEDRIQSLLRIKTRRTYSMNDFFKLFSRDQFWKKSNSRKDFTEYLIKTYSNEGDTVLDFTMGSGSTGVACINTGRNFIGVEKDDKYFDVATQRIAERLKNS